MGNHNFKERGIENFWSLTFLEKYMTLTGGFIAGGCFKNLLSNQTIKDIDVYFETESQFNQAVHKCDEKVNSGELRISYENERVKAYVDIRTDIRIELIRTLFGSPKEIISKFDFTITKFTLFKENYELKIIHHNDFFEHLNMKRLVIDDLLLFPISTFERTYKYRDYGYKLCKESKVKLVKAINDQPLIDDNSFNQSFYAGLD